MSEQGFKLLQQASAMFHKGDVVGAQKTAQQSVQQDPRFAEGWFFLAKVALAVNQAGPAAKLMDTALNIEPDNIRFAAFRAYVLSMAMEMNAALSALAGLEEKAGDDPTVWSDIGNAYHTCGELESAQRAFQRAHDLDPANPTFEYNLATSCKFSGDFERAEQLTDSVLKKKPDDWAVYEFRSGLRKQTAERNHIEELNALLDKGIPDPRGEFQVAYALAKEYEDLDDLTPAFANYKRAADLRRKGMAYEVSGDVEAMRVIREAYTADFLKKPEGHSGDKPIFIVGLPRTGTTLLERIMTAHSDVLSAGELQNFGNELIRGVVEMTPGVKHNKVSMIRAATELDHSALGKAYVDSVASRTTDSRRFIDKLPINFLYLGSIARALPDATLIHMDRHPMDAAFAIYKMLFSQAYPFSYDLEDLGHYYVAYRELMDYWHEQLGDRLLRVNYEDLVADTETHARRAIAHAGLEWQPECLEFHKNAQPTNTASAAQVREKVYSSSVQKWRRLENELAPFRKIIEAAGISTD